VCIIGPCGFLLRVGGICLEGQRVRAIILRLGSRVGRSNIVFIERDVIMVAGTNDETGTIGRAFDRIGVLLRCVVVGFLTLLVWMVVTDEVGGYSTWVAGAGAVVCGLLIYSLHVCVLARIIWRPLIMHLHIVRDKHPWISKEQRKLAKAGMDRLLLDLSVSRLRRRISEDAETRSVQKGLDRWRGMVGFLYCAGYSMIIVPLVVIWPQSEVEESALLSHVVILGALTLFGAIISDYIETWRELWAGATYKTPKATRPRRKTR